MRYLLFIASSCWSLLALAQSKTKFTIGGSINPLIAFSLNTSSSQDLIDVKRRNPDKPAYTTLESYIDSTRSQRTYKGSVGFHVWANYLLNKKWTVQAGLGYVDIGFQRQHKNVQFNDMTYPGMGDGYIMELSGSTKTIDYNYRFQYIQIPVVMNYHLKQSRDYKWMFYLSGGLAANVLVKHQLTANLSQFVVEGEERYNFDSTGYNARPFAVNLLMGAKAEYSYEKNILFFAQPLFSVSPVSITGSKINVYPFYLGVNLGLVYTFDNKK